VREWLRRNCLDIALAVTVLVTVAPIVQTLMAQQASRMALTAAIWDDRSLWIDGYPIGLDKAERDDHTYSDKAPGQPILAVPAYATYRALGGEPARVFRPEGNLGPWMVSIWSCALPAAALAVMIRRTAARFDGTSALGVALAVTFGTLVLPFSSVLFGHVLAATLAFAGWRLLLAEAPERGRLAMAGALLGAAVLVEYTLILAAVACTVHAIWRWRRAAAPFLLGAMPPAVLLALYQWAAFGDPFAFSYSSSTFGSEAAATGAAVEIPLATNAFRVLLGERGLFITTPVVLAGAVGLGLLIRASTGHMRSALAAAAASAASLVAVQMLWSNPTGGDSPGARYATAAGVFVVPGLAYAWTRWRFLCTACAAVGATIMLAATWTNPLEARGSRGSIGLWGQQLLQGEWTPTIYTMWWGPLGNILLAASTAGAGIGLARVARARRPIARVEA